MQFDALSAAGPWRSGPDLNKISCNHEHLFRNQSVLLLTWTVRCRVGGDDARKRFGHGLLRSSRSYHANWRNGLRFIPRTSRTSRDVFRTQSGYSRSNCRTTSPVRMSRAARPQVLLCLAPGADCSLRTTLYLRHRSKPGSLSLLGLAF